MADPGETAQTFDSDDRRPKFERSREHHLAKPGEHLVAGGERTTHLDRRQCFGQAGKEGKVVILDSLDQGADRVRAGVDRGYRLGHAGEEVVGPSRLFLQSTALDVLEDLDVVSIESAHETAVAICDRAWNADEPGCERRHEWQLRRRRDRRGLASRQFDESAVAIPACRDVAPRVDPVRDEREPGDLEQIAVAQKVHESVLVQAVQFDAHTQLQPTKKLIDRSSATAMNRPRRCAV